MREVVQLSSFRKVRAGKELHQIIQSNDTALRVFLEALPITKMFFRPEEVHRTSRVFHFVHPFPEGHGNMADQSS